MKIDKQIAYTWVKWIFPLENSGKLLYGIFGFRTKSKTTSCCAHNCHWHVEEKGWKFPSADVQWKTFGMLFMKRAL